MRLSYFYYRDTEDFDSDFEDEHNNDVECFHCGRPESYISTSGYLYLYGKNVSNLGRIRVALSVFEYVSSIEMHKLIDTGVFF